MAPIATLTVRLSAQLAEFQKSFADTSGTLKKFTNEFEGVATKAAAVGSFFGNIAADIARSVAAGFGRAISDAVRLSSEFSNSLIGLSSVSRAFGVDADAAKNAARGLSADGLMPLKDSATGLKNLLATGFSLDQSIKLMDAFKDSAAFGRQGALSFGDAVRSATEGVKNGNSILVDNAGVTKNLSQILKEAGFSAQDLSKASSDAAVRMALFNGILKETRAQTGDAAKLTMTYAGQVSRLSAAYDSVLVTVGAAITQNETVALAIRAVGDAFASLNTYLTQNRNAFNLVSDAVIFITKSMSNVLFVVDLLQTGFAGLQIAFNNTAKAGLEMVRDLATMASLAAHLRASLDPVFGDEWRKRALLADGIIAQANYHIRGFADASKDAEARSIRWGNTLQSGVATLDALTKSLEASRGKTVELGGATTSLTGATDANTAAGQANTKVTSEMTQVKNLLEKANRHAAAALDFETAAWKRWEQTVSHALSNLATNPVLLQGRNLSGIVPLIDAGGQGNLAGVDTRAKGPGFFGSIFGSSQQFGEALSSTILGAIQGGGNPVSAAAGMVGSKVGAGIAGSLTKEGGKLFGSAIGGALSAALPVLGSFVGPVVDKIWGHFFGTKGRDLVKDFAAGFGGFDALHLELNNLGADGERLWIALTQGVGRNNPEQAKAAIDAITAALARYKTKQEEAADAAEAAAQKQQEALDAITAKYKTAIDKIDNEYKRLSDSVAKEAEEEHRGIVETMERAEMERLAEKKRALEAERDAEIAAKKSTFEETYDQAVDLDKRLRDLFERGQVIKIRYELPDGTVIGPGQLSSSYNDGLMAGSGALGAGASERTGDSGTMNIQVRMDGRTAAQAVVPYIPGQLAVLGVGR